MWGFFSNVAIFVYFLGTFVDLDEADSDALVPAADDCPHESWPTLLPPAVVDAKNRRPPIAVKFPAALLNVHDSFD